MIGKISEENLSECAAVIRASFQTVADAFGFTAENVPRFTAFAVTRERLLHQLIEEHRPMFGWFEDGKIVGYYSLALLENGVCELNNLCVLPKLRHDGIGERLLSDALVRAGELGCRVMKLSIVEENAVLRAWYEAHGFTHTGTKKFDFFPFTCGYMEKAL
ncbi:MAG: GNAT family N-acetyltransferase [Oscillospiraceae bacterium]|nr:GNAT family N-acetyltransferase [Oscillospiraceae bacterium]